MKKFALLLLSLTLCFALAACGGSDTSADEQAAADDTAASTTADESADTRSACTWLRWVTPCWGTRCTAGNARAFLSWLGSVCTPGG